MSEKFADCLLGLVHQNHKKQPAVAQPVDCLSLNIRLILTEGCAKCDVKTFFFIDYLTMQTVRFMCASFFDILL